MFFNMFSEKTRSTWCSHKTIYFVLNQEIKSYKKQVLVNNKIVENKLDNLSYYFIINNSKYSIKNKVINYKDTYILNKDKQHIEYKYIYSLINNKCLKLSSQTQLNQIYYSEYIYLVNQNLLISISFFKELNKYLSISFTSYIKQVNKSN